MSQVAWPAGLPSTPGGVVSDANLSPCSRRINFGSAHLFVDGMGAAMARSLLEAAVDAGAARLDTAPSYGYGASEALVAAVAANNQGAARIPVTTKVGLEPASRPPGWRRGAARLLRALPDPLVATLHSLRHGNSESTRDGPSGRFELDVVQRSIERSLARLGPIDRLLLHEVHPADVTQPLMALLAGYHARGDVAALGVATGNAETLEALRRSAGLFTVAHVSVDASGMPSKEDIRTLPGVQWVGHGALGAGGCALRRVQRRITAEPALQRYWKRVVVGTEFEAEDGLAAALFARATADFSGELLVATSRLSRVRRCISMAGESRPLPAAARRLLDSLLLPPTMSPLDVGIRLDGLAE